MKRTAALMLVSLLLAAGCSEPVPDQRAAPHGWPVVADSAADALPVDGIRGAFTKNASIMPLRDYVVIRDAGETELTVVQTPSVMTVEEKDRIRRGENSFFVLSGKVTPDTETWQWYPYVATTLRFKDDNISAGNVESLYIMAYGIEQQNFTDNINAFPDDSISFSRVEYKDGRLVLSYAGSDDILDDSYSWSVDIK